MAVTNKVIDERAICEDFAKQVEGIAVRFAGSRRAPAFPDLVQAGFLGLIIAARRWRPDGPASLLTYATPWIKEQIREHLDSSACAVRVPKRKRKDRKAFASVGIASDKPRTDYDDSGPAVVLSTPAAQEAALIERERAAIARTALDALPDRARRMVEMVLIEEHHGVLRHPLGREGGR